MPKLANGRVPSYRHHRQSGQAIVTLSGRDVLLGKFNSPESKTRYEKAVAEWIAGGRIAPQAALNPHGIAIVELVAGFFDWSTGYYKRSTDGKV